MIKDKRDTSKATAMEGVESSLITNYALKPNKVTNVVLGVDNARKGQILISSIILLKTALDALRFLSKICKKYQSILWST
ncbi:hypothetical protein REPUB_Repub03eG0258100 [Reevesia pubescens]